jgi:LysR family transcriptional regulator, cyn operon transcriptional activator
MNAARNLRLIELRHLRYFLAVADASHFTQAARRLHVTQPTLSHQIRRLEGQLNLLLFDRLGKRVRLTTAGELLAPYARRVMRELEQAQSALGEMHGLRRGSLRVGVLQTVNACVIPEIISRFGAAYPGIRVTCAELSVEEIEAAMEAGRLDLAVSFIPPTLATLEGEQIFEEELVAVVGKTHPLAGRGKITVRDLATYPQVLLGGRYCTRRLIDRALETAGVKADVLVEMNSIESILKIIQEGRLASILPALALCRRETAVAAIRLNEPTPRRAVGLLRRRGAERCAAAAAFARVTSDILAERGLGTALKTRSPMIGAKRIHASH